MNGGEALFHATPQFKLPVILAAAEWRQILAATPAGREIGAVQPLSFMCPQHCGAFDRVPTPHGMTMEPR